jgi:hypothetical protein
MFESLLVQIVVIIGIPALALVLITPLKAMSSKKDLTTESAVEVAMDAAILAAGAFGGIFANVTIYTKWGPGVIAYGILVTISCLCMVAWLAWIRKRQEGTNPKMGAMIFNLFLGIVPLALVTSVLILGYTKKF